MERRATWVRVCHSWEEEAAADREYWANFSPADFLEPGRITQLGYEPKRIDILTSTRGVTFAEAWERREAGMLAGQPVHYLSRADLIRSKEAAGRSQDLTDLESLR